MCLRRHDASGGPFVLPGSRTLWPASRPVLARHLKLDLTLDFDRRRIEGVSETTLRAARPGVRQLAFDAVEMSVSKVTLDGAAVPFHADGTRLLVDLPAPLDESRDAVVSVTYSAQPRRGLYFIDAEGARPRQAWTQGQDEDSRYWFPCLDAPAQKATLEVIARVPPEMTVISNGTEVGDRQEGGRRVVHHRLDVPVPPYLVTLVAGGFAEGSDRLGDVNLAWFVPPDRAADAPRTFAHTTQMMELFGRLTGTPYPYPKYDQVVVADFIFGGMENTSATTLTDVTLHDEKAHVDYSSEPLISHELAHQWFGDLLTCRDWPHGWLNEGFATYCEILWREHADGADEADQARAEDRELYLEEVSERYRRPIVTREMHGPIDLFDRHLYEKGAMVLHEVRRRLGDELFFRAIGHYVQKHRGGNVETSDLARAIEESTGQSVDELFEQWIFRPGHPELAVKIELADDGSGATVEVKQTQATEGGVPLFTLPLPVRFTAGSQTVERTLSVSRQEERFFVPLPDRPTMAIVDGRGELAGVVKAEKPAALWIEELARGREAMARTIAARALGKVGSAEAREALVRALTGDAFWGVRAAAARALGELRTEAAQGALIAALATEKHAKVRRAVVKALSTMRGDARAETALLSVLAGDVSWFVEGEAARSLGTIRTPGAFDALKAALARPAFQDAIQAGALDGLAKLGEARGIELARSMLPPGKPAFARRAALGCLAELGRGRREVVEEVAQALQDRDFRMKLAAAHALGEMGDAHALPALAAAEASDLDGRMRRSCREAARRIREGAAPPTQLAAVRDELETLKTEVARLREELGRRG